jgi:hypothetical protein
MQAGWRVLGWYLPAVQYVEAAEPAGHEDPAGHVVYPEAPVGQ